MVEDVAEVVGPEVPELPVRDNSLLQEITEINKHKISRLKLPD
jgi:hypothetical protein